MNAGVIIMFVGLAVIGVGVVVACFGLAGALGRVQDAIEDEEAGR